jgi:hypothetical protein
MRSPSGSFGRPTYMVCFGLPRRALALAREYKRLYHNGLAPLRSSLSATPIRHHIRPTGIDTTTTAARTGNWPSVDFKFTQGAVPQVLHADPRAWYTRPPSSRRVVLAFSVQLWLRPYSGLWPVLAPLLAVGILVAVPQSGATAAPGARGRGVPGGGFCVRRVNGSFLRSPKPNSP